MTETALWIFDGLCVTSGILSSLGLAILYLGPFDSVARKSWKTSVRLVSAICQINNKKAPIFQKVFLGIILGPPTIAISFPFIFLYNFLGASILTLAVGCGTHALAYYIAPHYYILSMKFMGILGPICLGALGGFSGRSRRRGQSF